MKKDIIKLGISFTLLLLSIILLPDQYLFEKSVPNSIWTKYFPLPFGAGWFITFLTLSPILLISSFKSKIIVLSLLSTLVNVVIIVPISFALNDNLFTLNNIINQYMWVSIIVFPPHIFVLILKWLTLKTHNQFRQRTTKSVT